MASPDAAPLVLVTGATGVIGPPVVRAALSQGLRVRTLTRSPADPALLPDGIDIRIGDVTDNAIRRRALEGVDQVLHLAARLRISSSDEAEAHADIAAAEALGRDAVEAGVSRLVLFSSTAVYGDTTGIIATEDTLPAPATMYARAKLAAEAVVLDLRRAGQPIGTVLRVATTYGPRMKGNYRLLVRHLAVGRPLPVLPGSNRRTLVFDDDVGRAALLASAHPAAAGRLFNVTDGATHTLAEIVGAICEALGRRPPARGVPVRVARACTAFARPILRGPLAPVRGMVDKYAEDAAIDGRRIQDTLGFRPAVGLREGWERTVSAIRASNP